ncbi:MAG: hypothetical protein ACREA4_12055 [Nitrososphaera sp.]
MDKLTQKSPGSNGTTLFQGLMKTIQHGGFKSHTSQENAREIMGPSFFGIDDAIKHFGVSPSKREIAAFADVPFSTKILIKHRFDHILVAVFPLSILDIRSRADSKPFFSATHFDIVESVDVRGKDVALKEQRFAKNRGKIGWHLVRKEPAPNCADLSWWWQRMFLGVNQKVPTARVLMYTIIGYHLLTGQGLFTELPYTRCVDRRSSSRGVAISNWGEGDYIGYAPGIRFSSFSRFFSCKRLGIACQQRL